MIIIWKFLNQTNHFKNVFVINNDTCISHVPQHHYSTFYFYLFPSLSYYKLITSIILFSFSLSLKVYTFIFIGCTPNIFLFIIRNS